MYSAAVTCATVVVLLQYLQPAPRAMLLSFCTVTLESLSVNLSMALRRAVYSDWSMGYIPELQQRDGEGQYREREAHT